VWPPEDGLAFLMEVRVAGLELEGLWTHLAASDDDPAATAMQLERFAGVVAGARAAGLDPRIVHAANSAATIMYPEARFDLVRPGIALYGVTPAPGVGTDLGLRPALRWRSAVSHVRRLAAGERLSYNLRYAMPADGWVATVPVGYADGYPRPASGSAHVLMGGALRPVAGTITMDQLMVDCGHDKVAIGDEAVLIGRQGAEVVTAEEWAGGGEDGFALVKNYIAGRDQLGPVHSAIVCGPEMPAVQRESVAGMVVEMVVRILGRIAMCARATPRWSSSRPRCRSGRPS
jgi:alanine racemase